MLKELQNLTGLFIKLSNLQYVKSINNMSDLFPHQPCLEMCNERSRGKKIIQHRLSPSHPTLKCVSVIDYIKTERDVRTNKMIFGSPRQDLIAIRALVFLLNSTAHLPAYSHQNKRTFHYSPFHSILLCYHPCCFFPVSFSGSHLLVVNVCFFSLFGYYRFLCPAYIASWLPNPAPTVAVCGQERNLFTLVFNMVRVYHWPPLEVVWQAYLHLYFQVVKHNLQKDHKKAIKME